MTFKNAKTVMFASLIAAMILPLTTMGFAVADDVNSENIGKTLIKEKLSHKEIPLKIEKKNLLKTYQELESDSEKVILEKQIDALNNKITQWYEDRFDQSKYDLASEKQQILSEYIVELSYQKGITESQKLLPISMIGYDYVENSLEISINPKYFTSENIEGYLTEIRNVVGNQVDITISPMEILKTQACTSRTASVCDPIKGGVEFEVDNDYLCTVGFKATYDGDTGFMTAGHCIENLTSVTINQPDHDSDDIGDGVEDYYYHNSDCDCGFVKETHANRSMDDGVYGLVDPGQTANPFVGMTVTMSGAVSGNENGNVDHINTNAWVDDDNDGNGDKFIKEFILSDYGQDIGDSGAPVMSGNSLVGLHAAGDGEDIAVFTKHNQFTEHFSGMSWGF